ncbi:MAG: hypothetical protein WCK49_10065, partial [Myxococcaceae bacterium]
YEDCVESSLFTLTLAFKAHPVSRDRVPNLEYRTNWAQSLANKEHYVYATGLDGAPKTHELKATWPNMLAFFKDYFKVEQQEIGAICESINPDFSCVSTETKQANEERKVIRISFKDKPYLKWTIWQKFDTEGHRITGDSILEDLRMTEREKLDLHSLGYPDFGPDL